MQTRFKFTAARLAALRPRSGKRYDYFYDTEQPRLAIGVGPSGPQAYKLVKKIGGKQERIPLARYDEISIDDARDAVRDQLTKLAAGENIAVTRRAMRGGITHRENFEDFLQHRRSRRGGFLSEATKRGYRYDFDNHLTAIADKPVAGVTQEQIAALHSRLGRKHPTTANRVLALVSALHRYANERKLCEHNPARGIRKFPEHARERFLLPAELPKFMDALAAAPEPWRWLFSLALFSGARRGNVIAARWSEFDLDAGLWRIPHSKRGTAITVPLSPEAVAVVKQIPRIDGTDYLFPSHGDTGHITEPKKAWADLAKRAGLPDLKIHDLRRTFGSWQATTGASLPVIGKSLGHSTPQATQVYARLTTAPVLDSINTATAAMLAAAKKGNKGAAIRKVLGQTRGRK
jgi:integrase